MPLSTLHRGHFQPLTLNPLPPLGIVPVMKYALLIVAVLIVAVGILIPSIVLPASSASPATPAPGGSLPLAANGEQTNAIINLVITIVSMILSFLSGKKAGIDKMSPPPGQQRSVDNPLD